MILKEFPDINWLKKAISKDFAEKKSWDNKPLPHPGWPTAVLNVETAHVERIDIKGPFSIFLNKKGVSQIRCDKKTISVSNDNYVLSNHGQHYDLRVDQTQPIETYNIHFGDKLFKDTVCSLSTDYHDMMDNLSIETGEFNLPIKSGFRDTKFNALIKEVELSHGSDNQEYALHELLSFLLTTQSDHYRQIKSISNLKISTKTELIKRIYLAVDFIHAHYTLPITLDQMAETAMLSKFHFLRIFKSVFHLSPHQYIKRLRVEKATALIKEKNLPLYLIAQEVGIENGSSLSRMMYQVTGRRPTHILMN